MANPFVLSGREAMARMLWTDTVKEAGRQAYHNQQIKKSTEQFKAATQLLTTFNDRGNGRWSILHDYIECNVKA